MGSYFKPWRRKLGLFVLVLACVCAAVWVRGIGTKDVYQFGNGEGKVFHTLVSSHHGLMWIRSEHVLGLSWVRVGLSFQMTHPRSCILEKAELLSPSNGDGNCAASTFAIRQTPTTKVVTGIFLIGRSSYH